jgi:hypothetical protein
MAICYWKLKNKDTHFLCNEKVGVLVSLFLHGQEGVPNLQEEI